MINQIPQVIIGTGQVMIQVRALLVVIWKRLNILQFFSRFEKKLA